MVGVLVRVMGALPTDCDRAPWCTAGRAEDAPPVGATVGNRQVVPVMKWSEKTETQAAPHCSGACRRRSPKCPYPRMRWAEGR
jgi:hypothetical protein